MEKRTKKMLLAVLMIISVLATDFLVLGQGIMTYASELSSETNNANVEFSVYFKDGENRVDSVEKSIKDEDVKLYAEIKVKNEGYLKEGTVIELENSNFNLKNEIATSNTYINSIEENKVELKQIGAGETVELELGIEPAIADKITEDYLSQTSTVKMIGSYVYSKAEDGQSIRTDKEVCVNYVPDETTQAELETDIITNKVLTVNGTKQRIVQLLIKSRLTNNEYPVQETKLTATIPELSEEIPEVSVLAINETTQISKEASENGITEITLNYKDENDQVNWNKNVYDEIVITYIYPEIVDASKIEIKTDSEIKVYNSETIYATTHTKEIENQEPNSVIMGRTEITTKELYKGNIYANFDATYNTETEIVITNVNIAEEVVVHEGPDVFGTIESEMVANTKYVSTEINLENMLDILGQDGNVQIKNGETTTVINKDSEVDANGNVVINYENSTSELDITTSNPVNAGILELKHTKAITANNYAREQLQNVKKLITKGSVNGTITVGEEKQNVISNATESATLELKETTSKAELTIENNKTALSTTQANEVTLGITLVTDGVQYDLYKNPQISLKFPAAVENVELISEPSKQNAEEFTINVGKFDTTNKTMSIELQGEQTAYPESELTQCYIQLNLNITLDSLATSQTDKIMMAYTNENASQYENETNGVGVAEQSVQISAPSQLIKMFNLSSNENTSLTETILQKVNENEAGKTLDFGISLINNKDSSLSNLKILGKLPTTENTISGQDENTLETTLKGITAENATIYYTENSSATADVGDATNGWTQDLATLTNAKLYLIKIDSLERGAKFVATVTVQLPSSMAESGISYTQYGVVYDTATEKNVKESSRKIGLATSLVASIKTEITAKVGQDTLNNGDTVKEGEVIRYTVTLKNKGTKTLENVQLKLDVPEGTTYVRPIPKKINEDGTIAQYGYVYANGYYEEITDSEQLSELTTITIQQLTTNQSYTVEYEVRVNKGTSGTEITNSPTVIYDETKVGSTEFSNKIQEANIRVTIKRSIDESNQLYAGGRGYYKVYVENLSNETINNIELQIISDEFTPDRVDEVIEGKEVTIYEGNVPEKITISELLANDMASFYIEGLIDNDVTELNISAIVSDSYGKIYRANLVKEELPNVDLTINISSPQNGAYIKEGDTVEYNITVKNTGDVKADIAIMDNIPSVLQVQSDKFDNNVYISGSLDVNETVEYTITTKVGYIPNTYHGNVITNTAKVKAFGILKDSSEMITHILKSSEATNDNVENIISGFAWFDLNENGQKDGEEEFLQEITVKIYDLESKEYLKDEDGNVIQTVTDENGQYVFSSINDGSYLVVFEYDTDKYVLTTAFAENVDTSINSKATIKSITGEKYITRLAAIEISKLEENTFGMNLGLKNNIGETPEKEQPGIEEIPTTPDDSTGTDKPTTPDDSTGTDNPTNPGDSTGTDNPTNPETPTEPGNTGNPEQSTETKKVSGYVWLDSNTNGQKDKDETYVSGIKVRLYNVAAKTYITNENGEIVEITTDGNGKYEFSDIEKGSYIVVFEYDTEEYKLTTQNSNIVLKKIKINGKEITAAVTDTINVQNNVSNINIGLRENLKFDLELNKYISKIVVQTSKETKTYDYEDKTLGKVEIHRKQIQGANVVLEYTIKLKNTGEIAGYAKNIVDYLPNGLTFSSELNTDWYLSGSYLHTKSLENTELNPGEEKEIKLILTKTMTSENVGLINNQAEIYQDYNQYGESDIDSTPNNQAQDEDDFGTTDVIIQVATGGSTISYIILVIINIVLIYVAIRIMIRNGIIEIKTKEERR